MRRLAEQNPTSSDLQYYLARTFLEFKESLKAASAFERAAEHANEPSIQLSYEGDAARAYARGGNLPRAFELFEKIKAVAKSDPELTRTVATDLRMFAESEKDTASEIAVMEHMMALKPADSSLRFDLAFKHSEFSNEDMAFDHYLKIPVFSRTQYAWNNLGVSYGNFHQPIKSVQAFKQAELQNNTLAMANLGWRLINAGFINEARELTEKATKIENYHENITDLVKRVKQAPSEEDKKEAEAIEKVQPKAAFYRQMGGAVFDAFFELIDGKWQSPDCVLEAKRTDRQVVFTGSFEMPANSLAFALNPLVGASKVTRRVTFTVKMNGGMLAGEVKRKNDGESSPTLASWGIDGVRVLMYVDTSEHRSVIKVMEGGGGDTYPRFYDLTRMTMAPTAV